MIGASYVLDYWENDKDYFAYRLSVSAFQTSLWVTRYRVHTDMCTVNGKRRSEMSSAWHMAQDYWEFIPCSRCKPDVEIAIVEATKLMATLEERANAKEAEADRERMKELIVGDLEIRERSISQAARLEALKRLVREHSAEYWAMVEGATLQARVEQYIKPSRSLYMGWLPTKEEM